MGTYLNKIVQTPNLDAMAHKSLIFNRAFTSASSCSPSRSAILTGQPSHQNGMYGLHNGVHHFNSFDDVLSLPKMLQNTNKKVRTGLIGKKHVGPGEAYRFDYEQTEENHSINQVGRNITNIKLMVREFLNQTQKEQPFFLVVAFHDPHRCGDVTPEFGPFCERWGSGEIGMGLIPDWHPIYYVWDQINLPYYIPDTEPARRDIAAQYTTISRLDQGVGLVLKELELAGVDQNTLVMYTSDNGPPLPSGRTNLYNPGMNVPMFLHSPDPKARRNQVTNAMTSLLDITPTFLDWFQVDYKNKKNLTGKSLLPLLANEPPFDPDAAVFGSQSLHEVTMAYPMRAITTPRYKLIHNVNHQLPFPIDQDFYVSWTFQDILNRTIEKQPLPWYKTLNQYYHRDEWELYDLKSDPAEMKNVAAKKSMQEVLKTLQKQLAAWLEETKDPWRCAPGGVLMDRGEFKEEPQCLTLGHEDL